MKLATTNRREFLATGLTAGAGLLLSTLARSQTPNAASAKVLNVALIGAGMQGRAIINAALPIPGIRFQAVCDIWEYRRNAARALLSSYGHQVNDYTDYREMLEKEPNLQAVIVATPDFVHAEHADACLKAGLHVYCERMMSNSIQAARSMVRTMRETGRLLQIGYQRRSNPRYLHVYDNLLQKAKLAGQITQVNAQWHQPAREDLGWPKKFTMLDEALRQYGYASMHEFRNWRWFKKYGGGPFAEFGAHQIDVADWFLGSSPKSVMAGGGVDFYKGRQWPDNITAFLEYAISTGTVRGLFQVLTTTSGNGEHTYEHFLGTDGSVRISENPKWTQVYREPHAPDWGQWVRLNYLVSKEDASAAKPVTSEEAHVRETGVVVPYDLPVVLDQPPCQPHLQNFFDAIRGQARLACPADLAFGAEVVVGKINEALEAKKVVALRPEDFVI